MTVGRTFRAILIGYGFAGLKAWANLCSPFGRLKPAREKRPKPQGALLPTPLRHLSAQTLREIRSPDLTRNKKKLLHYV
jgi:hypothetical protein